MKTNRSSPHRPSQPRQSKRPRQLSTMEYLRGDGSPSASDMASMLAEADAITERTNRLFRPPSRIPAWLQQMIDPLSYTCRKFLYEIFFLLMRLVVLVAVYIVFAAVSPAAT